MIDELEKIREDDEKRAFTVRALCSYIGTLPTWEDVQGFIKTVSPQKLKEIIYNAGTEFQNKLDKVKKDISNV